jgi:hypothetical protein
MDPKAITEDEHALHPKIEMGIPPRIREQGERCKRS